MFGIFLALSSAKTYSDQTFTVGITEAGDLEILGCTFQQVNTQAGCIVASGAKVTGSDLIFNSCTTKLVESSNVKTFDIKYVCASSCSYSGGDLFHAVGQSGSAISLEQTMMRKIDQADKWINFEGDDITTRAINVSNARNNNGGIVINGKGILNIWLCGFNQIDNAFCAIDLRRSDGKPSKKESEYEINSCMFESFKNKNVAAISITGEVNIANCYFKDCMKELFWAHPGQKSEGYKVKVYHCKSDSEYEENKQSYEYSKCDWNDKVKLESIKFEKDIGDCKAVSGISSLLKKGGLSGGIIALIVIIVILVVAAAVFCVWWFWWRPNHSK